TAMKKSAMSGSPDAVQGPFKYGKDPRTRPEDNDGASNNYAVTDIGEGPHGFMKKFAGAGIDLDNLVDHLIGGGDPVAQSQQQKQRGKQGHQAEIAHGRSRSEEIVFMKMMNRVGKHSPPGRTIFDSEKVTSDASCHKNDVL